jgi:hypothetical protein
MCVIAHLDEVESARELLATAAKLFVLFILPTLITVTEADVHTSNLNSQSPSGTDGIISEYLN